MPEVRKYLEGFGITNGRHFDGYVLSSVEAKHVPIQRYRYYEYPITMTFSPVAPGSNPQELLNSLHQATETNKVIYTSYHNPYMCDFGTPQIKQVLSNGNLIVETLGHAHRIYK